MTSIIVILAIIISIALGYKTKINTGFFAIAFAYLIGCFILDLSPSQVISMWPIKIFYVILSVCLFYNFAMTNGTLEKLAQHLLYSTRKAPLLLPYAIFFTATLIAGLGAGYYTVLAFFAPITLILCEKTGLNKLVGALAANYGALAGANFITSGSGIIFKGLIENAGYINDSYSYTSTIFITTLLLPIIVLSVLILLNKRSQKTPMILEIIEPEKFDKKQKTTLQLMITMVLLVLALPVLSSLMPSNTLISLINSKVDIGFIAIIFSIIAFFLKLGQEKEVIALVPWSTLIMICGVGMLISVAIKAGTIELLSQWISLNIPVYLVPIVLCIVGGFMSFFSSTLGVVTPALFPIIPIIATTSGIDPAILFTSVVLGAQATSISPFSSGGSLILGSAKESDKERLFNQLIFVGAPLSLVAAAIFCVIFSLVK